MTPASAPKTTWDPSQYEQFASERSRPFYDLLAAVDLPGARRIADLGCGTGSLTAELAIRWPGAYVEGVDSSPEMLEKASRHGIPGRLEFRVGDLRDWEPDAAVDLIVANASLQWVPDHLDQLRRLAALLEPGGQLAFQVPGNFSEPSHRLLDQLRSSPRWREVGAPERPASHAPAEYLATLAGSGLVAQVWETTYHQVLAGDDAVLEWMKGTALRPVLSAMAPANQPVFLAEYGALLREAYPTEEYGTVLPFRRVFAVATRPAAAEGTGATPPGRVSALDHVQIAIPEGGEDRGRDFYGTLLGLVEVPKPAALAGRGGRWFRGHRTEIHLGAERDFRPARKAHVALSVAGIDDVAEQVLAAGHPVTWDDELAPRRRFYTDDPFGNRIELLSAPGSTH